MGSEHWRKWDSNQLRSQLGREGQEEKDHRYRSHAVPQDCLPTIQERFPCRPTQGSPRRPRGVNGGNKNGFLFFYFGCAIGTTDSGKTQGSWFTGAQWWILENNFQAWTEKVCGWAMWKNVVCLLACELRTGFRCITSTTIPMAFSWCFQFLLGR